MIKRILFYFAATLLFFTQSAFAEDLLCMAKGQPLPINNEQVLEWKFKSKNQYKNRGHIAGFLKKVYKNKTGHRHLQVQIGEGVRDTIEIVYNEGFGRMPDAVLTENAEIEACGDYITSNKRTDRFKASPDGAIIHWVHRSTASYHDSGYVIINGVVYGMKKKNQQDLGNELELELAM